MVSLNLRKLKTRSFQITAFQTDRFSCVQTSYKRIKNKSPDWCPLKSIRIY